MRNVLLASAALFTLVLAAPSVAAPDHRGGQGAGAHQGGGHGAATHEGGGQHAGGNRGGGQGGSGHQGHGHGGGAAILAPAAQGGGTGGHRDHGGHSNNAGATNGGGTTFGAARRGTHAGRGHNSAFDALRRAFNAPHRYRHGTYRRPSGWYAHQWNYGEFLPSIFFTRNYWLSDYEDFDLTDPPPGTVWVRYGNDALLIDQDSGEVIQVEYNIFY